MSFEIEYTGRGVDLVVTGDWSSAAREALESGRADGLSYISRQQHEAQSTTSRRVFSTS
jgi:hypothetical protein